MPARILSPTRGAAGATFALAVLLAVRGAGGPDPSYLEVLGLGLAATAFATSYVLCRGACQEARVLAVLVAVGAGVGALLATTVGSPGEPARQPGWTDVAVLVLSVAIPTTLWVETRRKGGASEAWGPTLRAHGGTSRPRGRGRRPDRRSAAPDSRA